MRGQSGFSLIELLIVITIIGILSTIVVANIFDAPDKARTANVRMGIKAIKLALESYSLDNGFYPTTEQGLLALVEKPEGNPEPRHYNPRGYLEGSGAPKDPWGNEYIYRCPGNEGRRYDIISLGADGEEGGEGMNQDIRSWERE